MAEEIDLLEIQNDRVKKKNLLLKQKYNLEELSSIISKMENKYNFRAFDNEREYSEMALILRQMRASFISPAYNYNRFIDALVQDMFWDDIKYEIPTEQYVSMGLRESEIIAELQNCLISIKMALDRSVKIFSAYYKGISHATTFGHINSDSNKAKGFMGYVINNKENDEVLEYVYQEYFRWIRQSVQPRDAIIHYDDLTITYQFDSKLCCEVPFFNCRKDTEDISIDFQIISSYVMNFYDFYKELLERLYLVSDDK